MVSTNVMLAQDPQTPQEEDMIIIADVINNVLSANADDKEAFAKVIEDGKNTISALLKKHPLYK